MELTTLRQRLNRIRQRWLLVGTSTAALWAVVAALALAAAAVWLDLVWEFSPEARVAALLTAAGGGCALFGLLAFRMLAKARAAQLARRMDEAGALGGEILTGWELQAQCAAERAPAEPTRDMARLAVARAARLAGQLSPGKAVSSRPIVRSLVGVGLVALVGVAIVVLWPKLAHSAWRRFTDPYADMPPFARTEFEITPGEAKVRYGDGLDIYARPFGAPVDRLELMLSPRRIGAAVETLPMFPESDGRWRAVLVKVTEPAEYHVRAHNARSRKYGIDVLTVPQISSVQAKIVPPPYTAEASYVGAVPKDGIAGLAGTKVELRASSNRPLAGGEIRMKLADGVSSTLAMKPIATGASEAVGQFEIRASGKLELRVVDVAGQASRDSLSAAITRLHDERPFVRILQPRESSLATPTAALPVELAAEDDYGISRVQLYRGLNGSRPLPMDVRRPEKPPRRLGEKVYLPLDKYGLVPGDEIKLFARVEDNDPAGAKGSESPVVTVRIISQEEFEKMVRVKHGLQVLVSKYSQARRRLESLTSELQGLRKKQKDESKPNEASEQKLAEENRQQLQRLAKRLRDEAGAIRKAGDHMLPYDLDAQLSDELAKASKELDDAARELETLQAESKTTEKEYQEALEKLANRLSGERKDFDEQASMPLEHLAKVFPLVADQQRFVVLVAQQRDLAERLAAVKDRDSVDDPAAKARLRDLEAEQHRLRDELESLLVDIETHATSLPDGEQFESLRETALDFVKEVRASGAQPAMTDAESAMTELAGTRAHAKASEAADILEKFLSKCESIGSGACAGLKFQPGLAKSLGNTVEQLLGEMGLGQGIGGIGAGRGGGGFSARRGPGPGLYGSMPALGGDMAGSGISQQGGDQTGRGGSGRPGGDEAKVSDVPVGPGAAGSAQVTVPVRYRQRVGQYFQRVADEAGDSPK